MPYYIMRDCGLLKNFKKNQVSQGISALKIFMLICLKSEIDENGIYSANLTYDQISQICSLSRKLVSDGLRFLKATGAIEVSGDRKKKYILLNCERNDGVRRVARFSSTNGHWCKLPFKGVVDEKNRITAFEAMTNRSVHELNALRLFLYLLMVRSRGFSHSFVTLKKIKTRLSINYQEVIIAIGYLQSLGLVVKVDVGTNSIGNYDERFSISFLVCGWEGLEWKPRYLSEEQEKNQINDVF
ncbi:hypothetical protein AB8W27_16480 [Cronobacter turicensis]|uniref:Replication protein n=1 Tax=Cronobacter turicensis (strain DSM 18703 / CCUG 55852 / LMG 23827 / z3032) TaxID=693216 RepID=C9XWG5_CROTZ|nr:hypothetical protein [Cronobacter turicensis]MDI6474208.1 hypothetical protein [Cronobacter turicensis]CBA28300.1 hypothetical protein CTU_08600 [Cronobacter turicensis z3032]